MGIAAHIIEGAAQGLHLHAAAVPAVAARVAAEVLAFGHGDLQLHFPCGRVGRIQVGAGKAHPVGPVFLGGKHHFVLQPGHGVDAAVPVRRKELPRLAGGDVIQVDAAVHIQLAVHQRAGDGDRLPAGRNRVAAGFEHRRGHGGELLLFHIVEPQAVALFVGKAPAVAPEGRFVAHLVILVLLVLLPGLFPGLALHGGKVRPGVVVHGGDQVQAVPHLVGGRAGQRQAEGLPRFAAVEGDLVKHGEQVAVCDLLFVRLFPHRREDHRFFAVGRKAAGVTPGRQRLILAGGHIQQAQVRSVGVGLHIGCAADQNRLPAAGHHFQGG